MPEPQRLTLRMDGDLESLSSAARDLESFMEKSGAPQRDRYVVSLAFEELATNVVKYGFDEGSEPQPVDISLEAGPEALTLTLTDSGREFNPLESEEPELDAPVEDREVGGLGLHLVRRMADSLSYKRENDRNILTVSVKRKPGGEEATQ